MILIWFVVGLLMVAVPFWFFSVPLDPWSSVTAGAIGGALFLLVIVIVTLRSSVFSRRNSVSTAILLAVMLVTMSITWKTSYDQSHFQRATLGKIRTIIGEGICIDRCVSPTLRTLGAYHAQKQPRKTPVAKLFINLYSSRIKDGLFITPNDQFMITYVRDASDGGVSLVSVDSVARGKDPLFKNLDGQTGRLQLKSTVTEKGVRYEREN